jgi:PRD domain
MGLDPPLRQRLSLLAGSDQIDDEIATFMTWALGYIETQVAAPVTDRNLGTLTTHLALALQRAKSGTQVESWDRKHDELGDHPQAVALADFVASAAEERLGVDLSPPEREFLALHLAVVATEHS